MGENVFLIEGKVLKGLLSLKTFTGRGGQNA